MPLRSLSPLTGLPWTPLCSATSTMDDRLSSDLASLRIDRNERPPSSGALRWLIGLSVVAAAAVAAWRVGAPMVEAQLFKTEVGLTEVALVSPAQAQVELTSTGYVVPQVRGRRLVQARGTGGHDEHPRGERRQARTGALRARRQRPANPDRELPGSRRGGARAGGDGARPARRDDPAAAARKEARGDRRRRHRDVGRPCRAGEISRGAGPRNRGRRRGIAVGGHGPGGEPRQHDDPLTHRWHGDNEAFAAGRRGDGGDADGQDRRLRIHRRRDRRPRGSIAPREDGGSLRESSSTPIRTGDGAARSRTRAPSSTGRRPRRR